MLFRSVGPKVNEWRGKRFRFMAVAREVGKGAQASMLANREGMLGVAFIVAGDR